MGATRTLPVDTRVWFARNFEVLAEAGGQRSGQQGDSIASSLPIADDDLLIGKVDVLGSQDQELRQPEACAVQ